MRLCGKLLEGVAVLVVDESTDEIVLQSKVLPEDMYEKQGGARRDLALRGADL